jgi:putative membrane protein (TIGR04086 family)
VAAWKEPGNQKYTSSTPGRMKKMGFWPSALIGSVLCPILSLILGVISGLILGLTGASMTTMVGIFYIVTILAYLLGGFVAGFLLKEGMEEGLKVGLAIGIIYLIISCVSTVLIGVDDGYSTFDLLFYSICLFSPLIGGAIGGMVDERL